MCLFQVIIWFEAEVLFKYTFSNDVKRIFIMEIVIKIQSADTIRQDQISYMAAEANLY